MVFTQTAVLLLRNKRGCPDYGQFVLVVDRQMCVGFNDPKVPRLNLQRFSIERYIDVTRTEFHKRRAAHRNLRSCAWSKRKVLNNHVITAQQVRFEARSSHDSLRNGVIFNLLGRGGLWLLRGFLGQGSCAAKKNSYRDFQS